MAASPFPETAGTAEAAEARVGLLRRTWRAFTRPSLRWAAGSLLVVGFFAGIVFWGGFNWAMELTNTETFCISCHEMEANVYREYRTTIHYSNRTGVRASCPDCHVPDPWIHKVVRKIQATNELWHHFRGSIDTPAKFEAKRMQLAQNVWYAMKTTDSRECRNCHDFGFMDLSQQEPRSAARHEKAAIEGKTCIDCHRGIAHRLPAGAFDIDLDRLVEERRGGARASSR
jgi:cytochrome c-type protein NapC